MLPLPAPWQMKVYKGPIWYLSLILRILIMVMVSDVANNTTFVSP